MSLSGSPESNPAPAKDHHGAAPRMRFTLALDLANSSEKRSRIASLSDLALHDLTSPRTDDGEKAVLQTPTPTQFLFPKNVTQEQEAYANGFERALEEIYKEKGPPLAHPVHSDDSDTRESPEDPPPRSGQDMTNVSRIMTSAATPRSSQGGAAVTSREQLSQCANQVFGIASSIASNLVNNNCRSSSANFNFATNLVASRDGCNLSQALPSVCRSQEFVSDMKAHQTGPMPYSGVMFGNPTVPVPFRSSVAGGHVTASGATVNWPANKFVNASGCGKMPSLDDTVRQIQAHTGTIPHMIRAQSGIIPHIQAQTGTVPSNHSNNGAVLHSNTGAVPGNNGQAGTAPPMHSRAGGIHPLHSQAGTVIPEQSQIATMVPMHSQIGNMVPMNSQIGNMVPMHSQTGNMVPMHSQTGNMVLSQSQMGSMVPMYCQAGTTVPIQSQAAFHSFNEQRTFVPQLDSSPRPSSSIYHGIGSTDLASNLPWSGLPSTGAEPGQPWPSMKCEVQSIGMVNMDEQERMKLERKRAKNRVAAQRCQMRKLERIARLEDKAERLREQNSKLLQTVDSLRGNITQLKKQITAHANKGCRLLLPDVSTSVTPIISSL